MLTIVILNCVYVLCKFINKRQVYEQKQSLSNYDSIANFVEPLFNQMTVHEMFLLCLLNGADQVQLYFYPICEARFSVVIVGSVR